MAGEQAEGLEGGVGHWCILVLEFGEMRGMRETMVSWSCRVLFAVGREIGKTSCMSQPARRRVVCPMRPKPKAQDKGFAHHVHLQKKEMQEAHDTESSMFVFRYLKDLPSAFLGLRLHLGLAHLIPLPLLPLLPSISLISVP